MAKAQLKTQKTTANVGDFLATVSDPQQREDAIKIVELMQKITGDKPKMWGPSIIGFGDRTLKYESGRELDWFKIGFSPRKGQLTIYAINGNPAQGELLAKLGKHTTGKGCLYIKRLSDVDEKVLEKIIERGCEEHKTSWGL